MIPTRLQQILEVKRAEVAKLLPRLDHLRKAALLRDDFRGFAAALDRGVSDPTWSADGKFITVIVADDRSDYPVRIPVDGGAAVKVLNPPVVVNSWSESKGRVAVIAGSDVMPNEIYVLENGKLRRLSHQNDELIAQLEVATTEEVNSVSKDGTKVGSLITYPLGYVKGSKVPLILWIHGGPNGQDNHSWSNDRQLYAANGYAVLAVNYRGSSGRGQKFSRAIAEIGRAHV